MARVKDDSKKEEKLPPVKDLQIFNADMHWWNMAGRVQKYNNDGKRQVSVFLDPKYAEELAQEGWHVKTYTPKRYEEDEEDYPVEGQPYLPLEVRYDIPRYPPKIYLVSYGNVTLLDEETIGLLDDADKLNVDVLIRGYRWKSELGEGVKAYIKEMYVTLQENDIGRKYADMPRGDKKK